MNIRRERSSIIFSIRRLLGTTLSVVLVSAWVLAVPFSASAASLEELFNGSDHSLFLQQARAEAAKGDAEALFLLGKAFDLGKGVAKDPERADAYYRKARAAGSARASHNLGLLALHSGRRNEAIVLLQEALERGLQLPTLYNLGLTYSRSSSPATSANLLRAAEYFARAYELEPCSKHQFAAADAFLRVYLSEKNALRTSLSLEDLQVLKHQATSWLQKGMDQDHAPSWAHYGVMLVDAEDWPGARKALLHAAKSDVALAQYHLGHMAEKGVGQERNLNEALSYYERGAWNGHPEARREARKLLQKELAGEYDLERLAQGLGRLAALKGPGDFADRKLEQRLAWGGLLAAERRNAKPLPGMPVLLQACGLGMNQPYGLEHNVTEGLRWQLVHYPELGVSEVLPISGVVDSKGCANDSTDLANLVKPLLDKGAILALAFPNRSLPLQHRVGKKTITLRLRPLGTPLPIP